MTKKSVLSKLLILSLAAAFILFKPLPAHTQGVEGVEGVDYLSGELIVKYTSAEAAETSSSEKSRAFYGVNSSALNNFLRKLFGTTSLADLDREFEVYEKIPLLVFADGGGQRRPRTIKFGQLGITPIPDQTAALVYLLKFKKKTVAEAVEAYNNHPEVEYAEPNYITKAFETPNDEHFSRLWGLTKIEAPQAWDITHGSSSVTVAVLDTGADYNHPDLDNNLVSGYDIVNADSNPQDDQGHGTHVAGTIGAETNNEIGIAGVNWEVSLMPVKVLNSGGSGSNWWLAQGIYWAVDNGAKVINMSLGGPYTSQTMRNAVDYAVQNGVIVVAAAGNNSSSQPSYPAAYPPVISVVATNSNDRKAGFSNYGSTVDISAPGVNICSTTRGGGYACWNGTSMASPNVAGLAALILAKNPTLSASQVEEIIENTAEDLGNPGRDNTYGHGRINAYRAIQAAGEGETPTPTPTTPEGPTNTPAPTITPGGPTLTPVPTSPPTPTPTPSDSTGETPPGPVSSCRAVKRNADVAIWNCAYRGGQQILLAEGAKVTKDKDYVAICYNRLAAIDGLVSVTVDRGQAYDPTRDLIDTYYGGPCDPNPFSPNNVYCSAKKGGCLYSGSQIYFPLGELASPEGTKHTYTLSSSDKTATTAVLVVK